MYAHLLSTIPDISRNKLFRRIATINDSPAPMQRDDSPPHRSYSQIRKFAACPLQWKLSRDYAPAFVSAGLVFGGAVHAAVEAFYRARMDGRAAELEELLGAYDRHWERESVPSRPPVRFTAKLEDAAGMRELAARMLTTFLASAVPGEVIAVEEPFSVTLAPNLPPIVGRIDLVEIRKDADGVKRLHLVDFKTAARRPAHGDLDDDQLLLYALAAEHMGWADSLGLPLALRFSVLLKTKVPELLSIPVTSTPRATARLVEKLVQCDQAMKSGFCYPSPSWACTNCGYAQQCAMWPEQPASAAVA